LFFNADCNEQESFFLKPEKNLTQICLTVFEKNAKKQTLILKNVVIEPKARPL